MVLSQIRDRKKTYEKTAFDRSVYLKRERNFLQHVRMENKEKIVNCFRSCTRIWRFSQDMTKQR